MVTRERKAKILEHLQQTLPNASLILLTDYKGLTVAQMRALRNNLREKVGDGAKFMVVKNTLLRITLEKLGYDPSELGDALEGPTAILYVVEGDPIEALKTLYDYIKENKIETFRFKGGFLEGKVFNEEEVETLAKLPSKQQLYAMLVSATQGPIRGFVYALSGIMRNLVYALNAIKDKKSE
ncbi:MAG: 50S ribosomal protein L10 [Thermotogaceae bacterium]|nr:50S ribosomal protein L10 [Thermotogaceae bacterium]